MLVCIDCLKEIKTNNLTGMAMHCRNLHQDDPFKKRHIFLDPGKRGQERLEAAQSEADKNIMDTKIHKMMQERAEQLRADLPFDADELKKLEAYEDTIQMIVDLDAAFGDSQSEFRDEVLNEVEKGLADFELSEDEVIALWEKVDVLRKQVDERLDLREAYLGAQEKAHIYFKSNGDRLPANTDAESIPKGTELVADFGFDELPHAIAQAAWSKTGLNNMVPTGIYDIRVKKPNGTIIDAYRGDEALTGDFYDSVTNAKVYVNDGDIVIIEEHITRAEATQRDIERQEDILDKLSEEEVQTVIDLEKKEVAARNATHAEAKAIDRANSLSQFQALKNRTKVKFSSELRGIKKDTELTAYMDSMDYGPEVISALTGLAEVGNEIRTLAHEGEGEPELLKGPFGTLDAIRKRKGINEKTVSYQEIGLVVLGNGFSPDQLEASYTKNAGAMTIYETLRQRADDVRASASTPQEAEQTINAMINEEFRSPAQRVQAKLVRRHLIDGTEPTELMAELEQQEKFGQAAAELLKYLPLLSPRDRHSRSFKLQERERGISEEQIQAEALLDKIFDRTDYGPKARVNLFRQVFNAREDRTMTMDLYYMERGFQKTSFSEKRISQAAAFQQILAGNGAGDHAESPILGKEYGAELNTDALISKIDELREKGAQFLINKKSVSKSLWRKVDGDVEGYLASHKIDRSYLDNPDKLTKVDIELVQLGMAFEQGEEMLAEKHETVEALKATHSDLADEVIDRMFDTGTFTLVEIQEAANRVDEQVLIGLGALADFIKEPTEEVTEATLQKIWAGAVKPIQLGNFAELDLGLAYNTDTGAVSLGAAIRLKKEIGRTTIAGRIGAGVTMGENGLPVEVFAGLEGDIRIDIGKYRTWGIEAGAGLGVELGPEAAFLGFMLRGGFKRNMAGVIERRMDKLNDAQSEDVEKAAKAYTEAMKLQAKDNDVELTDKQLAEYEDHLKGFFAKLVAEGTVDRIPAVSLARAGVAVTPIPVEVEDGKVKFYPWLYLGINIAGREYTTYAAPVDFSDEVHRVKIEKAIREQEGATSFVPVYLSGQLRLTESGSRTLRHSVNTEELTGSMLDKHNADLAPHGIRLVPDDEGRVELKVGDLDGEVDIFTDPKSTIETVRENGKVYINLSQADRLAMVRKDTFYPFRKGEGLKQTKLYISNNARMDPEVIEESSSSHLNYVEFRGATTIRFSEVEEVLTVAAGTEVTVNADGSVERKEVGGTYSSFEEMEKAGIALGDILTETDKEAIAEARAEMAEALGNAEPAKSLTAQDREYIRNVAARQILNDYPKNLQRTFYLLHPTGTSSLP